MKKRYYLLGVLVLIALVIGYHFYAGSQAAQQLNEAIQEVAQQSKPPINVSYSSIKVHSFGGDILFTDLSVISDRSIYRADTLKLDLAYGDFLNIYFGGANYGLKNITDGLLSLHKFASVNRQSMQEVKLEELHINYNGQLLDALQTLATSQPLKQTHTFTSRGKAFIYSNPESSYGSFKADSLYLSAQIPSAAKKLLGIGHYHLSLKNITWSPPESFQQQWAFFIQGFEYEPDAIPLDSLNISYKLPPPGQKLALDSMMVYTDLFAAKLTGKVLLDQSALSQSKLEAVSLTFPRVSESFQSFLLNIEQLLGITIPRKNGKIYLPFTGTLADPALANVPD